MVESSKISLELDINEAKIIANALRSYSPPAASEMISIMLYNRITKKLEEKNVQS